MASARCRAACRTVALVIDKSTHLLASVAVLEEIVLENLAECITARTIDSSQKAAQGRAMGQLVAAKECHEWMRKWSEPVKERFECGLATHGIAKQDGDKVQHVEGAGSSTGEAHALADRIKIALLCEIPSQHDDFGEPGRN